MHIRIQRRTKYCSQINLIINPQFIRSRQTHRKKYYIEQISKRIKENFVLRSKEREEDIQLITMDPKVYGKLLTHHRRGYGVDVEALRDRPPLWQIAGKGPKMGSHGYRRLWRWKQGFVVLSDVFRVYEYIQAKEVGRWSHEGTTRVGAHLPASWLPCCFLDIHSKSSGSYSSQKSRSRRFHSVQTPFDIPFLRNTETGNKTAIWAGPPVNRLVPKVI